MEKSKTKVNGIPENEELSTPTPWPNANARLLGLGVGLPVNPLDRLAQFSAAEFERFTLEWASDYLTKQVGIIEVQQRGGAGDKGRDVITWLDQADIIPRRWCLYQCKHYDSRLGTAAGIAEIGKVLYYTFKGDYTIPDEYWFVTHQGVVGPLQDLLDDPDKMKQHVLDNWDKQCSSQIIKENIPLDGPLTQHINTFPFNIFKAKQPLQLIEEHSKTRYHLAVFGAPLINRPPPKSPPSTVLESEIGYITQLHNVIGKDIGIQVTKYSDFSHSIFHKTIFERSRVTFYHAENLKELARDQMTDAAFFDTLMDEFRNGLFHIYFYSSCSGLTKMKDTINAAQTLNLGGHVLAPHVTANDREGICHHMANENIVTWC